MVKFNKHLQSRKVSKWAKDYIDYKSLKQIINEIYIKLRISDSQPQKKNEDKDLFEPKPMFSIENPQFSVTPDKPKEEKTKDALVQKFITELENEIKKFYYSYMKIENNLFVSLNKLLHNKETYSTLSSLLILSECEKIYLLTLDTRLFSDYVYINLEAIRKIAKKFDKKIKKYFNNKSLMLKYIKSRLDDRNSDLNYILQLKIVDDLILLIESILHSLTWRLNDLVAESNNKNKNEYYSSGRIEEDNVRIGEIESKGKKYIKEINNNLFQININGQYRMKYLNIGLFFNYEKNNDELTTNHKYLGNDNDFSCLIQMKEKQENLFLMKKFLPATAFNEMRKENESMISDMNNQNIKFLLTNRLISATYYSMNYGILLTLLKDVYSVNTCYLGLGMALIFMGNTFAKFIFSLILRNDKYYKLMLLISIVCVGISNLFCVGTKPENVEGQTETALPTEIEAKNVNSMLVLLMISRFLLGFGTAGEIEQKYINAYVPKSSLYFSIKKFNLEVIYGTIIGLLIGAMFSPSYSFISVMLVNNFIHFTYTIFAFTNPSRQGFSIMKKDLEIINLNLYTNEELHDKNSGNTDSENPKNERGGSIGQEDISPEEKEKVNETNEKLKDINAFNRFSDSNLIPQNATSIVNSYMSNQMYKLLTLTAIICVSEFINVSLHIIFPISLVNNGYEVYNVYMLIIPFVIFFAFNYVYNRFFSKKKFLKPLLFLEAFILFSMIFLFIFHIYILVFFYFFLIPINLIIQKKIRRFISLTFQNNYRVWIFNANDLINIGLTISKVLGALVALFFNVTLGMPIYPIDGLNFILFYFFYVLVCFSMLAGVTFFYGKKIDFIKMKILARIIKRKLY